MATVSRQSIGIGLVLAGLPLAWVARASVDRPADLLFSAALYVCGVALLISPSRWSHLKLHCNAWTVLTPLFALLPLLALAVLLDPDPIAVVSVALVICFHLLLCLTDSNAIATADVGLCIVATLASAATALYIGSTGTFENLLAATGRIYAGDSQNPNITGFIAALQFAASCVILFERRPSPWKKKLLYGNLVFAMAMLLFAGTRSAILGLSAAALAMTLRHRPSIRSLFSSNSILRLVRGTTAALLLLSTAILVLGHTDFGESFEQQIAEVPKAVVLGWRSLVLGEDTGEVSAELRHEKFEYAITHLSIAGSGYKSLYVDSPVLQSFLDLGLVGGGAFLLVALVFPTLGAFRVLRHRDAPPHVLAAALTFIVLGPNFFLHGQPYDFQVWLPVVFAYRLTPTTVRLFPNDQPGPKWNLHTKFQRRI